MPARKDSPERTVLGVAIGHAANDAWFGVAPVLLAAMSAELALSNAEIGLMILLYELVSSITQPFFGQLTERVGGRRMAVVAILWTTTLFSSTLFVHSKALLTVLIAMAGFGSGAFHPQGAANASLSGGTRWGATASSIFFVGGTIGSAFVGAALGGFLLDTYGRPSLLVISAITIFLALVFVRRMVPEWVPVPRKGAARAGGRGHGVSNGAFWTLMGFLLVATALRSVVFHTLNIYIPKYLQDMGVTSAVYGAVMALFLLALSVGGVAGSYIADRIGIREVLLGTLVLGALFLFAFVRTSGLSSYILLAVAGLVVGPSHPLFVLAGQRQFPERMIMITGIFLGFTFITGAGGAWLLGILGDRVGLGQSLGLLPWMLALSALCTLVGVPRAAPQPEPEGERSVA